MSMGVELIPAAIVVLGLHAAKVRRRRRASGRSELVTRFRDTALLEKATGVRARADGVLEANVDGVALEFAPDETGAFVARVKDAAVEAAQSAIEGLDARYGRLVQQQVAERVRVGASRHDLVFEGQEEAPDGSIVMTLRVSEPANIAMRLRPDGTVAAETHGLTGESCLSYSETLAELVGGEAVDSHYTADYYGVTETRVGTETGPPDWDTVRIREEW